MATIISCSLSAAQKQFMEEMGLSASELLQRSINEIFESTKVSQKLVEELHGKIERLQDVITRMGSFIDDNGLNAKWLASQGY